MWCRNWGEIVTPLSHPGPSNQSLQSPNMSSTPPRPSVVRQSHTAAAAAAPSDCVWEQKSSRPPPLPKSPPADKTQSAAALEEQICKLDLFAADKTDNLDGMHGCVWWARPRRIVDLWWPVFCIKSAAGRLRSWTSLLAVTLPFARPPSTTKPHVLCKTTNFTKKGHRYRGTLG